MENELMIIENNELELNNITKIEDITMQKASELISKNLKKKEEN